MCHVIRDTFLGGATVGLGGRWTGNQAFAASRTVGSPRFVLAGLAEPGSRGKDDRPPIPKVSDPGYSDPEPQAMCHGLRGTSLGGDRVGRAGGVLDVQEIRGLARWRSGEGRG